MKIEQVKIKELKFAEYNPRRLTNRQFDSLKASLEKFGFVDPVIVNNHPQRDNVIIGGHQRVKVWQKMGKETVPCYYVNLPEELERELNLRLNKNSGEWDFDMLANLFKSEDLLSWGFEEQELFGKDEPEVEINNYTEENIEEQICSKCKQPIKKNKK